MKILNIEINEDDLIKLTGVCTSFSVDGKHPHLIDIVGTVATIQKDYIKIWPEKEIDNDKLWFPIDAIEKLEILQKGINDG